MVTKHGEGGTGLIGSLFGAVAFLGFLLLATHILLGLYATSVLTSVAWDDARKVAGAPADSVVLADATADLRNRLKGFHHLAFTWHVDGSSAVGLTVRADRPSVLPAGFASATGLRSIERTVWVRKEELR